MSKVLKWLLGIIIALAVVAGGGYLYLRSTSTAQAASSTFSTYTLTRLQTGSIDTLVSATGSVRTNQSANINWQASGRVGKVNVKVGDTVKNNDILAILDPANLPNNIVTAQQNLVTDQKALDDLKNNKTNLPTLQKAVIDAQTAVDNAQTARGYLDHPRGTADQITSAKAEVTMALQKLNQTQSQYNGEPGDPSTDSRKAAALGNLEAAKTAYARAQSNLTYIQGQPSTSDIATADNNLALAKAKLADAQRALANSTGGVDSSQLAAAQARIDADNGIIDEQNLRAPFAGTITAVNIQAGDIASATTASFRIDDLSSYFIDLAVSEVDIAKVALDQPVTLAFDAIPSKTYNGKVTYVGQVGTISSAVVNFTVTVQITDADELIKPGITSSGSVVVNSIKNVLVVPNKAIKTLKGIKVVYVATFTDANGAAIQTFGGGFQGGGRAATTGTPQANGQNSGGTTQSTRTANSQAANSANGAAPAITEKFTAVQVKVGAVNDTSSEVSSSNLKVGAMVVTNPPADGVFVSSSSQGGILGTLSSIFGGKSSTGTSKPTQSSNPAGGAGGGGFAGPGGG